MLPAGANRNTLCCYSVDTIRCFLVQWQENMRRTRRRCQIGAGETAVTRWVLISGLKYTCNSCWFGRAQRADTSLRQKNTCKCALGNRLWRLFSKCVTKPLTLLLTRCTDCFPLPAGWFTEAPAPIVGAQRPKKKKHNWCMKTIKARVNYRRASGRKAFRPVSTSASNWIRTPGKVKKESNEF